MSAVDLEAMRRDLDRIENYWRANGATVYSLLRPGRTEDEIRSRAGTYGLQLPADVVAWWQWHDGADQPTQVRPSRCIGPSSMDFLTLDEALADTAMIRSWYPGPGTVHEQLPDAWWRPEWLTVVALDNDRLVVDCAGAPTDACPVRSVNNIWDGYEVEQAPSFAAVVRMWADALDSGYVYLHPRYGWDFELSKRSEQWPFDVV